MVKYGPHEARFFFKKKSQAHTHTQTQRGRPIFCIISEAEFAKEKKNCKENVHLRKHSVQNSYKNSANRIVPILQINTT